MRLNDIRIGVRGILVFAVGAAFTASLAAGCAKSADSSPSDVAKGGKDAAAPKEDSSADEDTSTPLPGDDASGTADVGGGNDIDSSVPQTPITLPFNLSDQFIPSGFMGMQDGLKLSVLPADCKSPRQPGAQGDCYKATWDVTLATGAASAWCGIYWQSPANNWGAQPGKVVASGATKVSFYAAGAVGGEQVTFTVGGINTKGGDPTLPYRDGFTIASPVITLTTAWAPYEVSLAGATYDQVLGGFSWVTTSTVTGNVTFYIDDVKWE